MSCDGRSPRPSHAGNSHRAPRPRPPGSLLTACGPKPLYEMPKEPPAASSRDLEREYSASVRHRRDGVGHAGRCPASCSPTRSTSRAASAAGAASTRASRRTTSRATRRSTGSACSQMDKDKGVDFSHADAYYEPKRGPGGGALLRARRLPAVPERARARRCARPAPPGPSRTASSSSTTTGASAAATAWPPARTARATSTGASRRSRTGELNPKTHVLGNRPRPKGVVEKCTFCIQRTRERPLSGLRRGLPGRRAQVRQPARPRERDPLHHRAQARARAEGRAEHGPEVLLLLRHVRCA